MSSAILAWLALVTLLEIVILRRLAGIPSDVRIGVDLDARRRSEGELAALEKAGRRVRRMTEWIRGHHEQLGAQLRAGLQQVNESQRAEREGVNEAASLIAELRELVITASNLVREARESEATPPTERAPERTQPPHDGASSGTRRNGGGPAAGS